MTVRAISRLAGSGRADAGNRPADEITPPPVSRSPQSGRESNARPRSTARG